MKKIVLTNAEIHTALSEYLNRQLLPEARVKVTDFKREEIGQGYVKDTEWTLDVTPDASRTITVEARTSE